MLVWNTFDPGYCHDDPHGAAEMIQILSDSLQVAKLYLQKLADLRGSLMEGVSELARDGLREVEKELARPRKTIYGSKSQHDELLTMLREFTEHYSGSREPQLGNGYARQWLKRARTAIAKAEGK